MEIIDIILIFIMGCLIGFAIGFFLQIEWREFFNYRLEKEKIKLYREMQLYSDLQYRQEGEQ